jgi:hypothetical protein
MGRAYSTYERRNKYKIVVENHMGWSCLTVIGIDGRIILKCILKKYGVRLCIRYMCLT